MLRKKIKLLLLLSVIFSMLVSCGFRLRGTINIPPEFLPLSIAADGVYIELTSVLRQTLQGAGLSLVAPSAAGSILKLKNERYEKQLLTVATSGESQTHSLQYTIQFTIKKTADLESEKLETSNGAREKSRSSLHGSSEQKDEESVAQLVTVTRSFQFEKRAVLSSATEEAIIKKEMLADAAQQILRRLNYIKTKVPKQEVQPNSRPDSSLKPQLDPQSDSQ